MSCMSSTVQYASVQFKGSPVSSLYPLAAFINTAYTIDVHLRNKAMSCASSTRTNVYNHTTCSGEEAADHARLRTTARSQQAEQRYLLVRAELTGGGVGPVCAAAGMDPQVLHRYLTTSSPS